MEHLVEDRITKIFHYIKFVIPTMLRITFFPTAQIKSKLIYLRDDGYHTYFWIFKTFLHDHHIYEIIHFQLSILNNRILYLAVMCSATFALKHGIKLIAKIPKTYNPKPGISLYMSGLQRLLVLRKVNPTLLTFNILKRSD